MNPHPKVHFEALHELIDLIYQAALGPACWQNFADAWSKASGGGGGIVLLQDSQGCLPTDVAVSSGFSESSMDDYVAHYDADNPFMEGFLDADVGRVYTSEELVRPKQLLKSEFYNDWTRPQGYVSGIGSVITQGDDRNMILSLIQDSREVGIGNPEAKQLLDYWYRTCAGQRKSHAILQI